MEPVNKYKLIKIVIFSIVILAGCNNSQSFSSYTDCVPKKKLEYIDAGGSAWESENRAVAFCETKFPLLEPSYKAVSDLGITAYRDKTCYPEMQIYCAYTFHTSQPVDFVTFSISNDEGQIKTFTRVSPNYYQEIRWVPDEPYIVTSIQAIEALVNVNKGKHQGD